MPLSTHTTCRLSYVVQPRVLCYKLVRCVGSIKGEVNNQTYESAPVDLKIQKSSKIFEPTVMRLRDVVRTSLRFAFSLYTSPFFGRSSVIPFTPSCCGCLRRVLSAMEDFYLIEICTAIWKDLRKALPVPIKHQMTGFQVLCSILYAKSSEGVHPVSHL